MADEKHVITCRIEPAEPLVCGEIVSRTFLISIEEAVSPQGRIRIYFTQSPYYRIPPLYGLPAKGFVFFSRVQFQTDDPRGAGYITIATESGKSVSLEVQPGRCFFTVVCEEGLEPGETLTVVIGDRSGGGPGAEVAHHTTYGDWQLVCDVDRAGDGNSVHQENMPTMRVVAAPPSQALVYIPSQAQPGAPNDLQIVVVDRFGNHVEGYRGSCSVSLDDDAGSTTTSFALQPEDAGSKRFPGSVVFKREGIHRVTVQSTSAQGGSPLRAVSNPVKCAEQTDDYDILWGDLHGHTYCSDGTHSPEFYFNYARTVGFLDFCALTDHDTIGDEMWQRMVEATARAYELDEFTTFLGYEWTGDQGISIIVLFKHGVGGYYPSSEVASRRNSDFISLLNGEADAMVMRHDMPGLRDRWQPLDATGELERLVEIYSPYHASEAAGRPHAHGPLDEGNSVQAALADGLRFGFIGCSDSHASMPGRRQSLSKGTPGYGSRPYGLTAVYARENTREEVFSALRARRCYAATDRILLDVRLNGHRMGEEISLHDEERVIEVHVAGTAPFVQVDVVKNNEVIHSAGQGATEVTFDYTDDTHLSSNGDYYYVRVLQQDGGMAWASPIWVDPM